MTTFTGMDVAAVRQLSSQLSNSAQQIRGIVQTITNQLNSTHWVGPDQQRFSSDWTGTHTQRLSAVAASLEEASRVASQNADEQEHASG